jgi:hypothetical protein
MLIEAVERRFGSVEAVPQGREVEFLSDNGGPTSQLARALGLKPINTPVCSLQSKGMAESFVNTFKRDYVARMDLSDARTVLAQLPAAFEHFNEGHTHSSLKMRSPREFRRQQAAGAEQALYCEYGGVGNTGATSKFLLLTIRLLIVCGNSCTAKVVCSFQTCALSSVQGQSYWLRERLA